MIPVNTNEAPSAHLDLPDGLHLHRVVVQHPQYRLQHPDVVSMLLDELLQLLDPVLLLHKPKKWGKNVNLSCNFI